MKYICMQQFDCFELYAGQVNQSFAKKACTYVGKQNVYDLEK